jgi:glyoxylase-like metal-dependent hydrolase (beta-lactamase superfamily II)
MTNCYLVVDESTQQGVLFDAPDHTVEPLLKEALSNHWDIAGLWLTHGHFDHFADHHIVKERFPDCQVLIHKSDEVKVMHPELQTRMFGLPFSIPPLKADAYVTDKEMLKIGRLETQVMHTPGHSPGHVAYYIPAESVLIGGDLIIGGSVGRTDLPDSDPEELQESIRKVMALPPGTRLLGGHGEVTTLERERKSNPWVQEALELG